MDTMWSSQALHEPGARAGGCNPRVPRAGSLSLGRWVNAASA